MKSYSTIIIIVSLIVFLAVPVIAELSPAELAAESEKYCKSTIQKSPTKPETIISKVNEACELLSVEGPSAFHKFKGKNSAFIFEGTYVWLHDLKDGTMLLHPIKHKIEGMNLINLKDKNGKLFIAAMNDIVNEKENGWIGYFWPIPGTNSMMWKVSYVKKCMMANGEIIVVGAGIYNGDAAALSKLDIH